MNISQAFELKTSYNAPNTKGDSYTIQGILVSIIILFAPLIYKLLFGIGLLFYLTVPLLIVTVFTKKNASKGPEIHSHLFSAQNLLIFLFLWDFITFFFIADVTAGNIYPFLKLFALVFLFVINKYSLDDLRIMRISSIISALYIVYVMLTNDRSVDVSFSGERAYFVFAGVAQDPNYICILLMYPLINSFSALINNKNNIWKKIISFLFFIYIMLGIFATGSRGAMLGAFTGIFFSLLKSRSQKTILRFFFVFLVLVPILLFVIPFLETLVPESVLDRFSLEAIFESSYGTESRTGVWKMYFDRMLESPWTFLVGFGKGTGVKTFNLAAHNFFIQEIFETGLIGFTLSLCAFSYIFKKSLSNDHPEVFASLLALMVMCCSLSTASDIQFWIVVAMLYIFSRHRINQKLAPRTSPAESQETV